MKEIIQGLFTVVITKAVMSFLWLCEHVAPLFLFFFTPKGVVFLIGGLLTIGIFIGLLL